MRKQAFLLAACAAVATGCGGGHHNTSSSTTKTTTSASGSGMTVTLGAAYGRVEVGYLTGQGRAHPRATGDTYLEITRQRIQNGDGLDVFNRTDGLAPVELDLSGFQTLAVNIDIPFGTSVGRVDSQLLTQFVFDPNRVLTETSTGALQEITGALPVAGDTLTSVAGTQTVAANQAVPANLEARIRAFPGRDSLVQLHVSDASFYALSGYTNGSGAQAYIFDQTEFGTLNDSTTGTDPTAQGFLASRLSDFVRFPLSGLAASDLPVVRTDYSDIGAASTSTTPAAYVYFSGDNVAVSSGQTGTAQQFQEIASASDSFVLGTFQNASTGGFTGTYTLTDAQPVDLSGAPTRLVSDYGSFHDFSQVLSGGGTFEMIMFPNSGEEYDDVREGDLVAVLRNSSGTITNLYYGGVSLASGTFQLYPIRSLNASPTDQAVINARISGTVSKYVDTNGATTTNFPSVRKFSFNIGGTAPAGFVSSGTAVVFRK